MTKKEAVIAIMTKSDDWLSDKLSDEAFYDYIVKMTSEVRFDDSKPPSQIEAPKCPECGGDMVSRRNKLNGESFWGCRAFPNCRGTRDSQGLSKEERRIEKLKSGPLEIQDEMYRFKRS